MSLEYVDTREARHRTGIRMVVIPGIPSPWAESAKAFLHLKRLPWTAVRLAYDDAELAAWTGGTLSAPVLFHDADPPRSGWAEILTHVDGLAATPALLPADAEGRARVLALSERLCGEGGLGWFRRLQQVHLSLKERLGFPGRVATYLGRKYGYDPAAGPGYGARVCALLRELAAALRGQRRAGPYYLGATLSAADVYSATFMGLFCPLPERHCAMNAAIRPAFELLDEVTTDALDDVLLEHRDMMYSRHLELPLRL